MKRIASSCTLLIALALANTALADEPSAPSPVVPPPSGQVQANGEYVAPMQQATQPTYVPQSVAMSGPREIRDFDEDTQRVPAGYHPETRVRKGLIIAGACTFGAMYLLTALVAAAGDDVSSANGGNNPVAALWVPVAGPFIQMSQTSSSTANFFLAIDGLAQAGGAAMLIGGIASPKTVLVRDDLAKVWIAPTRVGRDGYGLGMTGTF
jgi:hypothetical protein